MGFEILTPESETISWVTATERLWIATDGEHLVADGDPDAAFLFCTPGQQIPLADAQRFGLAKGKAEKVEATASTEKPEASAEPEGGDADELAGLSVKQLRTLAAERDVDVTGLKSKADLVAALEAAGDQAGAEAPDAEADFDATGDPQD